MNIRGRRLVGGGGSSVKSWKPGRAGCSGGARPAEDRMGSKRCAREGERGLRREEGPCPIGTTVERLGRGSPRHSRAQNRDTAIVDAAAACSAGGRVISAERWQGFWGRSAVSAAGASGLSECVERCVLDIISSRSEWRTVRPKYIPAYAYEARTRPARGQDHIAIILRWPAQSPVRAPPLRACRSQQVGAAGWQERARSRLKLSEDRLAPTAGASVARVGSRSPLAARRCPIVKFPTGVLVGSGAKGFRHGLTATLEVTDNAPECYLLL
ncbi:hypothetical protein NUW54_g7941 [Trametes sanguinea]|uniref:Uncharacterized protein n=1 Tax=Trametes sanguinea TaxID=158606 RepID=A0ACC1PJJ4_9APHY|nr:hypothetical protein NUW54_g7941 [Trametes sanguinea]